MNAALLSSKNMCWCTPQDFFDKLNEEFGFVLDAAATDPHYGREIGKWVQKAHEEAIAGGVSYCTTYPSADGYQLFSRSHIRQSRNSLRSRAASLYGRRRQRSRSRALPFNGCYL